MMQKVRTAVIPAAGLGTRMGMLSQGPGGKEALRAGRFTLLAEQARAARAAGIERLVVIGSPRKPALRDFVLNSFEVGDGLEVCVVNQEVPRGLGDAVRCAYEAVGDEPVLVLLPDDIVRGERSLSEQLLDAYACTGRSVCGLMRVADEQVRSFGIAGGVAQDGLWRLTNLVEKPGLDERPLLATANGAVVSNLAIVSGYVFTASLWAALERLEPGRNNEYQLTDAMEDLSRREGLFGVELAGTRFDTGNVFGYFQAVLHGIVTDDEYGGAMRDYARELLQQAS